MKLTKQELEIKQTNNEKTKNGPYIISVSQELMSDTETPVSTFYKLCYKQPYSFLLESVEGSEKLGRYSIIGLDPILIFTNTKGKTFLENKIKQKTTQLEDNPFIALKNLISGLGVSNNTNQNFLGFTGYFSYENIRWIEPKVKINYFTKAPDVCLTLAGKIIIFDHILQKVTLIVNTLFDKDSEKISKTRLLNEKLETFLKDFKKIKEAPHFALNKKNKEIKFKSNHTKKAFMDMVDKAKKYIKSGDIFQVVLSQKLTVNGHFDGLLLYRALRSINPSPYLFYLNYGDFEIAGSSPEVMAKCDSGKNKKAMLRPIAGTYPRGTNEKEDIKNISKLLNDPKEKAEHLMLVDLARNDLGRVCNSGTINIPEFMVIEKYSHVLHMVSQVEGTLKENKSSLDLLQASFPAGTLSGAPKVRALEIIKELEKEERGPYGGALGFFGLDGSLNTAMTIRTFIIYKDHLEIQAGAGIVADSNPENEYKETLRKGAALLKAVSLVTTQHVT